MPLTLCHTYTTLPTALYTSLPPVPVAAPSLVLLNASLAEQLGLSPAELSTPQGVAILSGNAVAEGSTPIAQAYAGHQFGHFTMLGDGRAILLGEQQTPDGTRYDIQLKGSGRTPYSRSGDGRAALAPMLREYLMGEAMHALGIPTTRALAVVATGEPVLRERALPGAILTRVAASHIRVGTYEYAARLDDLDPLIALADYTIDRHYPELGDTEEPYLALLDAVMERQAELVARWMSVGFIHGVMNTDNMALSGETIDYGPCAFMDAYDPATVFSSIDTGGRYAYANQPPIAQWNLARLTETLLPLLHTEQDEAIALGQALISGFRARYERHYHRLFRAKLGLTTEHAGDIALIHDFLHLLQQSHADFTNSFRSLGSENPTGPCFSTDTFAAWQSRWHTRLAQEPYSLVEARALMQRHNPAIIPRNHRVEEALDAATDGNLQPLQAMLDALNDPYTDSTHHTPYRTPSGQPHRTFCGT